MRHLAPPTSWAWLIVILGWALLIVGFGLLAWESWGCAAARCSPLALSGDGRSTPAVAFRPCPPPRLLAVPCP